MINLNNVTPYYKSEFGVIINGDCIKVLPDIEDNSVDLIILDPPYLTTSESWDKIEIINDFVANQLYRIAKESCSLYIWCGIGEKSQSLIRWFPIFSACWYFKDLITWKKQRGFGMRKGWLYVREEIMWFVKNNDKFIWNTEFQYSKELRQLYGFYKDGVKLEDRMKSPYKRITNVWEDIHEINFYNSIELKNITHYTPKPIELITRIIFAHTKENDLVLDLFLGSGTTALACKNTGRNFIGIEIDEKYCDMSVKRLFDEQVKLF